MVIDMNNFDKIVVKEITGAVTIFSPKGKYFKMNNRPCYGLSFCTEGQITYTHNNKSYISDSNHIIILPQNQDYTLKCDKTGTFYVINFSCTDVLCDTFLRFPILSTISFIDEFEKIRELILVAENRTKVLSIFYNLIYRLSSNNSICQTIAPAIKYIEKNYSNAEISNKALADACNISEVYLRKLFLKNLKVTPKQYLSEIRLSKAKQLLADGILKINAISEKCGFTSPCNFSRFFKEQTGISPTEYSKDNKIHKI